MFSTLNTFIRATANFCVCARTPSSHIRFEYIIHIFISSEVTIIIVAFRSTRDLLTNYTSTSGKWGFRVRSVGALGSGHRRRRHWWRLGAVTRHHFWLGDDLLLPLLEVLDYCLVVEGYCLLNGQTTPPEHNKFQF
jgi:hypothetical protein